MNKKHAVVTKEGTKTYRAAVRTLTFVGQYKSGRIIFSDLGLAQNWKAYQRERARLGLPKARE